MSREIKFRAWDKKQNKMLYGVSIGTIKVWDENAPLISHEFSYSEDCVFEQYTGLKDKNGEEIYEGDIVKLYDNNYIVKWSEPNFAFIFSGERQYYWLSPSKKEDCQVIGNIHENPELIGGEDE